MKSINHILVVRLSAMGDVAMTVPVIRELVASNPNLKVTVLSKPFLKPVFNTIPNVSFFGAEVTTKHKGLFGIFRLFFELRKLKIDAVADLHNVLRSKLLRFLFSICLTPVACINKGRSEKKALTRVANKIFKQLKTTHERYADVFRKLGFQLSLSNPTFLEPENLTPEIIRITGEKNTKWIGIAPFAQYNSKMYPLLKMEVVITKLAQENTKILLFGGGKKEVELLDGIAAKNPNVLNLAGKFKLNQELAVISNLDCMLSMDSGNAHFAAMLGVNTFTIWGVTHPFTGFAPFNQPFENAILPDLKKYPNIPCSIYGNKVCAGYENVMDTIYPETIVLKIKTSIK